MRAVVVVVVAVVYVAAVVACDATAAGAEGEGEGEGEGESPLPVLPDRQDLCNVRDGCGVFTQCDLRQYSNDERNAFARCSVDVEDYAACAADRAGCDLGDVVTLCDFSVVDCLDDPGLELTFDACSDGLDNDDDGHRDCADPSCYPFEPLFCDQA